MSIADRARAGIGPLEAGDAESWLAFQAEHHGPTSRQADPAWMSWQAANPSIDPGEPTVWVCRRDAGIVGSQGSVPFGLKEGGRMVAGAWATDLMVAPAWRLRGVGPALTERLIGGRRLVAGIGISDAAYRSFLRAGWRDLGEIPWYVRPRDVGWVVGEAGLTGMRRLAIRLGLGLTVAATGIGWSVLGRALGARLEPVARFDERVDRVWADAVRRHGVIAARDSRALAWRFDAVPGASAHERYYLVVKGRVRGYVVLRSGAWRGRRVVEVLDYLVAPRWLPVLFAGVARLPLARGASAITVSTLSPVCDRALRAVGFIPGMAGTRAGRISFRTNLATRFMVCAGPDEDRPALHRDRWFVTAADADSGWRPDPAA